MPTASDELRAKMEDYFGDPIDDGGPMAFLRSCGWTEEKDVWTEPADRETTTKEWNCLRFLCDEWDHAYRPRRSAP